MYLQSQATSGLLKHKMMKKSTLTKSGSDHRSDHGSDQGEKTKFKIQNYAEQITLVRVSAMTNRMFYLIQV